eukprot:8308674-Pyramimonas_sp.AAC.1
MTIRGTDGAPQRAQSEIDVWEPVNIAQAAQSLRGNMAPATGGNDMVDDDGGDGWPADQPGKYSPARGVDPESA